MYWVHCPVCGAQNDSWWKSGEPRYTGGFVQGYIPDENSAGQTQLVSVACLCFVGREHKYALEGRDVNDLPPTTEWITEPLAIVWVRGESKGPPPELTGEHLDRNREVQHKIRVQMDRYFTGQLTLPQLSANVRVLTEQVTQETGALRPPLSVVLEDSAQRALYFKPPLDHDHEVQDERQHKN